MEIVFSRQKSLTGLSSYVYAIDKHHDTLLASSDPGDREMRTNPDAVSAESRNV
jgi:hypothetical protein